MSPTSESLIIRPFKEEDKNFILATWLPGLYHGGAWYSEMPKDVFMKNYHGFLEQLLKHHNTEIKVSCLSSDHDVIIGYVVIAKDPLALHWVYVKNDFRKIGVASMLIPKDVKIATHVSKAGVVIMKKKGWIYNPFII